MNFGILVLLIAIILFALLAFKQLSALILAPVVTIFVLICSGIPIMEGLQDMFMPAAADYVSKYFLTFLSVHCLVRFTSLQVLQNLLHDLSAAYVMVSL